MAIPLDDNLKINAGKPIRDWHVVGAGLPYETKEDIPSTELFDGAVTYDINAGEGWIWDKVGWNLSSAQLVLNEIGGYYLKNFRDNKSTDTSSNAIDFSFATNTDLDYGALAGGAIAFGRNVRNAGTRSFTGGDGVDNSGTESFVWAKTSVNTGQMGITTGRNIDNRGNRCIVGGDGTTANPLINNASESIVVGNSADSLPIVVPVGVNAVILGVSGFTANGATTFENCVAIGAVNPIFSNTQITNQTIIGGTDNEITGGQNVVVIGGDGNTAVNSRAAVIGGQNNRADGGDSAVVGGLNATTVGSGSFAAAGDGIQTGIDANYSAIIGGQARTETEADTVNVPNLRITTIGTGTPATNLAVDSAGKVVDNNGATGTFTSNDGKTITVTNGIITNIA